MADGSERFQYEKDIRDQFVTVNAKIDAVRTMLYDFRVELANGYITKQEFDNIVNRLEDYISEKKDKTNTTNGFIPKPDNRNDFKEQVIFQLVDFAKLLAYALIILGGGKGLGLL